MVALLVLILVILEIVVERIKQQLDGRGLFIGSNVFKNPARFIHLFFVKFC